MDKRLVILWWIVVFFLFFTPNLYAQVLTESEKEALQRRVKDKVDEYQFYLGQLADKQSTSLEVKNNAFNLAIKLFIGECNDYQVFNTETNTPQFKAAVRMETSSKNSVQKRRKRMKLYLDNLRHNKSYTQIEITDADVVRVDNIYKVGDHYECMAYFCQKFVGYRDGRVIYSDVTTKKVSVYIEAIEIPMPDGSTQKIWNALLGDIYVVSTE